MTYRVSNYTRMKSHLKNKIRKKKLQLAREFRLQKIKSKARLQSLGSLIKENKELYKKIEKGEVWNLVHVHKKIRDKHIEHRSIATRVLLAFFLTFNGFILGFSIIAFLLGLKYIQKINNSLPDVNKILDKQLNQSTRIYDRKGILLYTVYKDQNREFAKVDSIPEHTKWALMAAEDIDFYQHHGVDYRSVASAVLTYLQTKQLRGASTLTQQLARNMVLTQVVGEDEAYTRSLKRKLLEMLVAFKIEERFTKNEILELQMNEVFLGGTVFGYQTASKAYFNKNVEDLTLSESAFLAGIIKSPTYFINEMNNKNMKIVESRRNEVLDLMYKYRDKTGITKEEYIKAKKEKIVINQGKVNLIAPHFVFYVIEELEKMYGADIVQTGGFQVRTTLDLSTQKIAESRLKANIKNFKTWYGVNNGAVVVLDPRSGEILAMVGSVNYNNRKDKRVDGNVNVAIMPRQMGSSVKPYTYMAAFRRGSNPGTLAPDRPVKYGNYAPKDWDNKFYGIMSIRTALNQSRNVPAVYTLNRLGGAKAFIAEAERLGITTLKDKKRYGLSITLGAGEMKLLEHSNAFGAFANSGVKYTPTSILSITDSRGNPIYNYDKKKTEKRVYSKEEAYMMNWILCQMGGRRDKSQGHMYSASGQQFCGKTGTTTGPKDLVTIGYYPKLVVGVWAGNNNGALTYGTRGQGWSENVPIKIVRDIMGALVPKYGRAFYTKPSGIANGYVCKSTGKLTSANSPCAKETTVYIKK